MTMDQDEAKRLAKQLVEEGKYQMRSCWFCNPAHEHLKEHDLIVCFDCGRWFYRGIDVTEYDTEDDGSEEP